VSVQPQGRVTIGRTVRQEATVFGDGHWQRGAHRTPSPEQQKASPTKKRDANEALLSKM
jgi:hypothetical protein